MLPLNSSPRFSAKIQMSPEGRSSGSLRRVAGLALWPWNTATRRQLVLPLRSLHCRIVPLSLMLRRAAALAGRESADAVPEPPEAATDAAAARNRANRRMGSKARLSDGLAQPNTDDKTCAGP